MIGQIDVSWRAKVVTGDERRRQGVQALVRDGVPGAAAHRDWMATIARIAGGDYPPGAHAPRSQDSGDRLGSEVRAVGETDDRGLDLGAEGREPAAKRGATPAFPVRALDHPGALGLEPVRACDDDDLVHRTCREPLEHAREQEPLLRRAEAGRGTGGENDGTDHLRENRYMSTGATAPIRYAKSGDVNIAYQVTGAGARDLVLVSGFVSHLEYDWGEPRASHFLERLASFSRLIRFDKRGTGLSDRPGGLPDLETRMDDVRAVMDAVGSKRAALFGYSEGGPMSILFAATYPERIEALVLYGTYAKRIRSPDYPWAPSWEERVEAADAIERDWGQEADLGAMAPNADPVMKRWWATRARAAASPGAARDLILMNSQIDVRDVLSTVSVPTLVLHRTGDRDSRPEEGRFIADQIPKARFIELSGTDHVPWMDTDQILDEVEEFLTGVRRLPATKRVLATVLFTDLVGSTERLRALGDRAWADLLGAHQADVRRELERFGGEEIDTAGDGFLAVFDGPARAIRCAQAVREAAASLELEVRAGVHTGEIERVDSAARGIAVHVAARVASEAGSGEVLVTATTRDLVAGSGLEFEDRGEHALKGIEEARRLYAAV